MPQFFYKLDVSVIKKGRDHYTWQIAQKFDLISKLFDYIYSTMNNPCVKLLKGTGSLSPLSCGQAGAIQRK